MDRAKVGGGLFCREGFVAKGDMRLLGAHIGGVFDLSGGKLRNCNSEAISADRVQIDQGSVETGLRPTGDFQAGTSAASSC